MTVETTYSIVKTRNKTRDFNKKKKKKKKKKKV